MALSSDIRIVIADARPIFRDGLRRVIDAEAGFAVAGDAGDGEEAVALALRADADVLLLDVHVPRLSSEDVLRALATTDSPVRTILLTRGPSLTGTVTAIALGAAAVLSEDAPAFLSNIFDKLGVSSRLELALYAVNHRLLDDAPFAQAS